VAGLPRCAASIIFDSRQMFHCSWNGTADFDVSEQQVQTPKHQLLCPHTLSMAARRFQLSGTNRTEESV